MSLHNAIATLGMVGWLVPAVACAQAPSVPAPSRQPIDPGDSPIVAEVGDRVITLDEVDQKALLVDVAAFSGLKLNQALYMSRSQTIEELVADQLVQIEADARGVTPTEILEQEIRDKVEPVDDAAVEAWFEANRGRIGARSLEQVREPIRALLDQQRHQEALEAFVTRMRETVPVRVLLDPPRVDVQVAANDPTFGPDGAPIQVLEFSDFQ